MLGQTLADKRLFDLGILGMSRPQSREPWAGQLCSPVECCMGAVAGTATGPESALLQVL